MNNDLKKLQKIASITNEEVSSTKTMSVEKVPSFQQKLKSFGNLYYFLVRLIGPVLIHPMNTRRLKDVCNQYSDQHSLVNLGSGPTRILGRTDIINADVTPYEEVDVLITSNKLPFKTSSIDLILSIAVLEHVPDPYQAVSEIHRSLKVGGKALVFVPFIQPFHAAPDDFTRWTRPGVLQLFKNFQVEDTWVGGGPTSGLLWVLQEWLALLCSFGIKKLQTIFLYLFMLLTAPIKLLDLILIYHPCAEKIASGFYILVTKEE